MPELKLMCITLLLISLCLIPSAFGKSDPAKLDIVLTPGFYQAREQRVLLANSKIMVTMECESKEQLNMTIEWSIKEQECWGAELSTQMAYLTYENQLQQQNNSNIKQIIDKTRRIECPLHHYILQDVRPVTVSNIATTGTNSVKTLQHPLATVVPPIYTTTKDGIYNLIITMKIVRDDGRDDVKDDTSFSAPMHIEFLGPHGYISAIEWPLLPFYGVMCIVYVIFGIIWLIVSFLQWRDLLRIQFWIGGVIVLGMLEKAFFYEEYHNLNVTGMSVQNSELIAEFVSCAKRTLARMLVIIMSLGFGIVKPRLGPMLHRVVGVGTLYFILASVESYLRVMRTKTDERKEQLVASIPLAVLDTGIVWWIFTSLVQTTRTLRLRRNMVKLSLYRHFTNTLIFSVMASVIFMLSTLRLHKTDTCTPGWHQLWIDTAFWHVLFSVLLLVIMILWRPTNNNQRYAFTPLLDNPEDEDDEEDQFVAEPYGVKLRGAHTNGAKTPPTSQHATTTEEDDLRWVEDNIPSSIADSALPILDSDEELINTKFEVSKMQ